MSEEKTIAEMTKDEQITRLVKQRNALWNLIWKFECKFGPDNPDNNDDASDSASTSVNDDGNLVIVVSGVIQNLAEIRTAAVKMMDEAEEIIGNTYVAEGFNLLSKEANCELPVGHELYFSPKDVER